MLVYEGLGGGGGGVEGLGNQSTGEKTTWTKDEK